VIDSDLSTVTAEADKVFRVAGPEPHLIHVEMQSSSDTTLPRRLLRYNALLDYRHKVRAWSVAILLRPEADTATLTGNLELRLPDGRLVHDFRYGVIRAWQQSVETILDGPLSLLPMAILADIPPEAALTVLERINERLSQEASEPEAARLMKSTFLLSGLRFEKEMIAQLILGVQSMSLLPAHILKDSSSFELLKDMIRPQLEKEVRVELEKEVRVELEKEVRVELEKEVRVEAARAMLVDLASDRLGNPSEGQKAILDGIADYERLMRLCKRVGRLSTWEELLES
jgi:hypothetical protein